MAHPSGIAVRARQLLVDGKPAEAETFLRGALSGQRDAEELELALGEALHAQGRTDEAIALLDALSARDPGSPATLILFDIFSGECRWSSADRMLKRMRSGLLGSADVALRPFRLMLGFDEPGLHLEASRRFARLQSPPAALPPRRPVPGQRIRVAYLSCNLNRHPMAACISELIELHDRERFQVYAFDWSEDDGSDERARLKSAFNAFVDIRNLDDADAAGLLRSEQIDIAVDLMGFTMGSRPAVLAPRPCPVQVNFLGYPGTSGAPWMDYIVGDPWVTPFDGARGFSEKIVQLPTCYLPSDRKKRIAARRPARAEHGLPEDAFVFCCTNHAHKITRAMFHTWLRILRRAPGSVLWLWVEHPAAHANLRSVAAEAGVDPARIVFAPRLPENEDHLARLALADLYLDTVPYNAHSSATDALWVGLPLISVPGRSFHSRVAASVLCAAELPDLICRDLEEYESKASGLAANPGELRALRERMAAARPRLPLFDTPGYAGRLDAAYQAMFEKACRGEAPEHARVAARVSSGQGSAPLGLAARYNQSAVDMVAGGRFGEAEVLLRQAIAVGPASAQAYNNLGNVLDELCRVDEAEAAYREAIAIDPSYAHAHANLSLLLRKAGRAADADAAQSRAESLRIAVRGAQS